MAPKLRVGESMRTSLWRQLALAREFDWTAWQQAYLSMIQSDPALARVWSDWPHRPGMLDTEVRLYALWVALVRNDLRDQVRSLRTDSSPPGSLTQ